MSGTLYPVNEFFTLRLTRNYSYNIRCNYAWT